MGRWLGVRGGREIKLHLRANCVRAERPPRGSLQPPGYLALGTAGSSQRWEGHLGGLGECVCVCVCLQESPSRL